MKAETSIEKVRSLSAIASRINDHYSQAVFERTRIRALSLGYAKEAILCGKALIEARASLSYGKWGRWLKECCPHVHYPTAMRYMAVARKISHMRDFDLEQFNGLRDIYLALGILPEESARAEEKNQTTFGFAIVQRMFSRLVERVTPREDVILSLPAEERQATAKLLEPLVRLHEKLCVGSANTLAAHV